MSNSQHGFSRREFLKRNWIAGAGLTTVDKIRKNFAKLKQQTGK